MRIEVQDQRIGVSDGEDEIPGEEDHLQDAGRDLF
jgi:hypothetical protein